MTIPAIDVARRWLATVCAVVSFVAAPALGESSERDVLGLDAFSGYACFQDEERVHGVTAGVDFGYVLSPFWVARGGYALSDHRGDERAFRVHRFGAGVRYQLDVFEYVPWLEVEPAVFLSSGDGGPDEFEVGGSIALGFDWLLDPVWRLGLGARMDQMFGHDVFPALMVVAVRLGRRWELGDPFAP